MAKVMRPILTFFAPLLLSQLLTPLLSQLPSGAQAAPEPLRIGGSSTVFPVVQTAIEAYQKGGANRQVRFELKETGTSAGFRQFCSGQLVFANASRPISAKELKALEAQLNALALHVSWEGGCLD